jgi:hypothetical protein
MGSANFATGFNPQQATSKDEEIRSWFHILGGNGGSDAQKADNSGTGLAT